MNYTRGNLASKKKLVSSRRNLQTKRVGVRLFKALLVSLILACLTGVAGVLFFIHGIVENTPPITLSQVQPQFQISFVYAADGTRIDQFVAAGANRIIIDYDAVPSYLRDAFIAIEDARFNTHNGVDLQGLMRAFFVGVASGGDFTEGGSTITQQLIKNNIFPNFMEEVTFMDRLERKLQEIYLAIQIEQQMSKEEIMEAYLNTINLGQNTLGVEAAARRYFGKSASELTISESAVIAGITQSPSTLDPVTNPEANAYRRDTILLYMYQQELITYEQWQEALQDNVYERIHTTVAEADVIPSTYFVDEVQRAVMRDLMERNGFTQTQAFNAMFRGGLTVETTKDLRIQQIVDDEVANDANFPASVQWGLDFLLTIYRENGEVEHFSREMFANYIRNNWYRQYPLIFYSYEEALTAIDEYKSTLNITEGDRLNPFIHITPQPQASVTVIDQYTGHVLAINGGRGDKITRLAFNRASEATRQPGSTFKTLAVFPPAIDTHGFTLATTVVDEPFEDEGGHQFNNWDFIYRGPSRVRFAIEHSMNVVSVKTLDEIGVQTAYSFLKQLGFTTLLDGTDPNFPGMTDMVLPMALGGISRGVTNLEMTAAYAAIANGGTYIAPIFYTRVIDQEGNVLLDNTNPEGRRVMQETTAALLIDAMEGVIHSSNGTGQVAAMRDGMRASGKTGTTENVTDLWLSAFTPYFTASVWTGFDTNKPMDYLPDQQNWHMIIWRNIMERIHEGIPPRNFSLPRTLLEEAVICLDTGLIAAPGCTNRFTEIFAIGTAPVQTCTGHGRRGDTANRPPATTDDNGDDADNEDGDNGDEPPPEPPPEAPPEPPPEPPPEAPSD